MPESPVHDLESLLAGLNPPQREAVEHGEGPLLILAGAGSGKTRVLTHRIAYLIRTGQAQPHEILAITFTNKAAQEMRERTELLLGRSVRGMWLCTFHSACTRMLRVEAERLGYTRAFTIYDQADSLRLVKRCVDELGIDAKRYTPRALQSQISAAKNQLRSSEEYRQLVGGYFEQTVADVYELYEREALRMNAMDFDDLLVRAVNVLELFPEVRTRYANAFRHVLVDEYQDTNRAQYRWLQLLCSEHRNLAVVGDDAQCLAAGTLVTMGDGSLKPIEEIRVGDEVLSCHNDERFGPASVLSTVVTEPSTAVRVTLASGRRLESTRQHTHFAGWFDLAPAGGGEVTHLAGSGGAAVAAPPRVGLPQVLASEVRPGMVMRLAAGTLDAVESVELVESTTRFHDLDVESTHNYVANGIVTHNSIYSFRSADIRNILDFEDDFPDAKVVRLEQNYRSTQTILSVANDVISHNRAQKPKHLWTDIGEGDPVKVRELADEHAEARYVVGEIQRMVDEGLSRSEIAVFYRTNAQSRVLEDQLVRSEIAYQVIGGTKFYDRAEIKDALAYLTALVNPADTIAFSRIANSPRRGIGQTSLSRVLSYANTIGEPPLEVIADPATVPGLGAAAVRAFGRFAETMSELRAQAQEGGPVSALLERTLSATGYVDALEAERTIEAQGRIENLDELVEVAREYDATAGAPSLPEFLEQLALRSDADTIQDDAGLVTLMTLHTAKGLEFPVVFIIGVEQGVLPHQRSIDEGNVEEERRLFYVGITRAMRDLTVTCAQQRATFGSRMFAGRSQFLGELPDGLVDRESSVRRTSWGAQAGAPAQRRGPLVWDRADPAGEISAFRTGDDVAHAAFGDGVVTGVEPGGIVVIRFAKDGSERKLVADLAPISKR